MASDADFGRAMMRAKVKELEAVFRAKHFAERARAPADVFVSYSSRDLEQARAFCAKLMENRIAYFIDEKEIEPGADLYARIEENIKRRKYYLLLLSKHSAASKWVLHEWATAGGADCDRRTLRLDKDVLIPSQVDGVRVDDDPDQLIEHYRKQHYDRPSIELFIRDLLKPINLDELGNFQPVPGQTTTWEHKDVETWAENRKRFPHDGWYNSPRIARIAIEHGEEPPKLHLRGWPKPVDQEIELKGDKLTLCAWWWHHPERVPPETVHPAFWCQALEELARLLDGTTKLSQSGEHLSRLSAVSWWQLPPG